MCDLVSGIITVGSLGIKIAKDVMQHKAQHNQAVEIVRSAKESARQQIGQLSLRATQEQDASGLSIMAADRQARIASGQAIASAGEAGVGGASVDAILHDITRQDLEFRQVTNKNLNNTLQQVNAAKSGVRAEEQSRINQAPFPSNLATGLNIAGDVLDFGAQVQARLPKAG